ncbi:Uncharacterised protein [Campylobacter hyointestinalis subsp. hyointestinalis]|nr:Uncharacterised protein [Campylobacter hyointestinalis subsp. hyointestinalis]CUU92286.1 Uncharacterised protein [Campylobacter hyointestinalis subsp. hyointestinalis]
MIGNLLYKFILLGFETTGARAGEVLGLKV